MQLNVKTIVNQVNQKIIEYVAKSTTFGMIRVNCWFAFNCDFVNFHSTVIKLKGRA